MASAAGEREGRTEREEEGGTAENEGKKGRKEIAEVGFNDIEEGICARGVARTGKMAAAV